MMPPLAVALKAAGTKEPTGAKMMAASKRHRRLLV